MRVLVVLPGARGVYPREAEQRRIDVVKSYSTPEVEVRWTSPRSLRTSRWAAEGRR